MRRRRSKWFN